MKVPSSNQPHPSCDLCKSARFDNHGCFVYCEERLCKFEPRESDIEITSSEWRSVFSEVEASTEGEDRK